MEKQPYEKCDLKLFVNEVMNHTFYMPGAFAILAEEIIILQKELEALKKEIQDARN